MGSLKKISLLLVALLGVLSLLVPGINLLAASERQETASGLAFQLRNQTPPECFPESPLCNELEKPEVEPSVLDFESVTIGQVIIRYVRVRSHNRSFEVTKTIQSDTSISHVQVFTEARKDLVAYKLRVALLPRVVGGLDVIITIFTSLGRIKIPVIAKVAPSPFRILPIEHPRVPLNGEFSADITLYNPLESNLEISTLYITGGPFHLTLPDGEGADSSRFSSQFLTPWEKSSWSIQPFKTQTVAVMTADTRRAFPERSFLRIMFKTAACEDILIPINIDIREVSGVYSTVGVLDFGVVRRDSAPVTLPLVLRTTSSTTSFSWKSIVDESESSYILVSSLRHALKAGEGAANVANVTFSVKRLKQSTGIVKGNIRLISDSGDAVLSVPYRVFVAEGRLLPSKGTESWLVKPDIKEAAVKTLTLENLYDIPVTILNATILHRSIFSDLEIVKSDFPTMLPPFSMTNVISVRVASRSPVTHSITIQLFTNLGLIEVPVRIHTGLLTAVLGGINHWLLDSLTIDQDETGVLLLRNLNPVALLLKKLQLLSSCLKIKEVSVCTSNGTCAMSEAINGVSANIASKGSMKLTLQTVVPDRLGPCLSTVNFSLDAGTGTSQVQAVSFKLNILPGRLRLYEEPIIIKDLFPCTWVQRNITVFNTFKKDVEIMNIYSEEFPQLAMDSFLSGVDVSPQTGLAFDTLTFDARYLCKDLPGLCYVGFDLDGSTERSEAWKRPFRVISHSSVEVDRRMLNRTLELWNMASGGESLDDFFNIDTSVKVTTKDAGSFHLPITLQFIFPPPLINPKSYPVAFPLLTIGNFSEIDVELINPTHKVLFVQAYVLRDDRPAVLSTDIFYVKSIVPKGTSEGFYGVDDERLPSKLRLPTPVKGTAASVVPPGGTFLVRLVFQPKAEACITGILYLRNNLTFTEAVPVRGCGVEPKIRFSNDASAVTLPTNLTVKFTTKDALYCHDKTVETGDRSKILRTGKFSVLNTGGAYVSIERVEVQEEDWYHRSFALPKSGPFLLAPNKSRRLLVEFNPDFGQTTKVGKVLVHVTDRNEPFVYKVVAQVDAKAAEACRPVFGRSENDWSIQAVLLAKRWGWLRHVIPVAILAFYLMLGRGWYEKRLRDQFIQKYFVVLMDEAAASKRNSNSLRPANRTTQESLSSFNETRRRKAPQKQQQAQQQSNGNTSKVSTSAEISNLLPVEDSLTNATKHSLREAMEKQIPEALRELFCVAYFASVPFTYLWNFPLPKGYVYRVYLLCEVFCWPLRFIFAVVVRLVNLVLRSAGYQQLSIGWQSFRSTDSVIVNVGQRGIVVAGKNWSVDWNRMFGAFKRFAIPVVATTAITPLKEPAVGLTLSTTTNNVTFEHTPTSVTFNNVKTVDVTFNGSTASLTFDQVKSVLNKMDSGEKSPQKSVEEVVKVKAVETGKLEPLEVKHSPRVQLVATAVEKDKYEEEADSPVSSVAEDLDNDQDNEEDSEMDEVDEQNDQENEFEERKVSARRLRRRQMHQAKKAAEKAAKMAKTRRKTETEEAEEAAAKEEKDRSSTGDSGQEKEGGSDSEWEREKLRAKRMAKVEANRALAKRTAKGVTPSSTPVHSLTNRAVNYPVQVEVIQQAFYRVVPKENGLMFSDMNRDECLQLVKQLKRDYNNLFTMDPKAAVELLQRSTKTNRYRIDGEFVDLARKSTFTAFAEKIRTKKEGEREVRDGSLTGHPRVNAWKADTHPRTSQPSPVHPAPTQHRPRSAVRADDRTVITQDGRWSLSPVSSDGPMDTRLSPGLSYADVAGHTHATLSRKSSLEAAVHSNAWKATSPSCSDKTTVFPWDMPLAGAAARTTPAEDGSALLKDYQEKYSSSLLDFTACPSDMGEFVNGVFLDSKSLLPSKRTSLLKDAVDEKDIWSQPATSSKKVLGSLGDSWFSGTSLGDLWSDRSVTTRPSASASSEDWPMSPTTSTVKEATASSGATSSLLWPTELLWSTSSFFMEDDTKPQFQESDAAVFGAIGEPKPVRSKEQF
ncbi:hypothetical protein RvY_17962 [Ramazzottius varieornatus]|uniref:Transmembrane protein n=1 Tax=Ramazzottius varieornatus TaxID=947166 RepID=A0A1D1W7M4_RAMVA|nr:hypothetical protein RvY_17962 [Ramazzottius varieornatus]